VANYLSREIIIAKMREVIGSTGRVLFGTGHKDQVLALNKEDSGKLVVRIKEGFDFWKPTVTIMGLQTGADRGFAREAMDCGNWLVCGMPYEGMTRGPLFEAIMDYDKVLVHLYRGVTKPNNRRHAIDQLLGRNKWMVDLASEFLPHAACMAVLKPGTTGGGTMHASNLAKKAGMKVWPIWHTDGQVEKVESAQGTLIL